MVSAIQLGGVPLSRSVNAETALKGLEEMLLIRIEAYLDDSANASQAYRTIPVPQSDPVSTLHSSTLQSLTQMEEALTGFYLQGRRR